MAHSFPSWSSVRSPHGRRDFPRRFCFASGSADGFNGAMDETKGDSGQPPGGDAETGGERKPQPPAELRRQYIIWSVIVFLVLLWFIRDGWFNQDPKMLEHQSFNRVGSVFVAAGFLYCVYKAVQFHLLAKRAARAGEAGAPDEAGR